MNKAISVFFSGWGKTDTADIADAISFAFGDQLYYCDPQCAAPVNDVAGLTQMVAMFGQHMPDGSAEIVKLDEHHCHARATVAFKSKGKVMMHGHYFADLGSDGKITRLVGFTGLGMPQ